MKLWDANKFFIRLLGDQRENGWHLSALATAVTLHSGQLDAALGEDDLVAAWRAGAELYQAGGLTAQQVCATAVLVMQSAFFSYSSERN